jgi:dTDP-4-dehydrorhamnose reductase
VRVRITGAGGQVGRALLACAPRHVKITSLTHAELNIADAAEIRDV